MNIGSRNHSSSQSSHNSITSSSSSSSISDTPSYIPNLSRLDLAIFSAAINFYRCFTSCHLPPQKSLASASYTLSVHPVYLNPRIPLNHVAEKRALITVVFELCPFANSLLCALLISAGSASNVAQHRGSSSWNYEVTSLLCDLILLHQGSFSSRMMKTTTSQTWREFPQTRSLSSIRRCRRLYTFAKLIFSPFENIEVVS